MQNYRTRTFPARAILDPENQGRHPVQTVREIAQVYYLEPEISRAISFNPTRLERIWEIPVNTNFGLKSSAGRASVMRGIELHPGLFRVTTQDFIATFMHEVAHIMQWLEYGCMDHGQTWWEAMIRLGRKPWQDRRHNLSECRQRAQANSTEKSLDELGL